MPRHAPHSSISPRSGPDPPHPSVFPLPPQQPVLKTLAPWGDSRCEQLLLPVLTLPGVHMFAPVRHTQDATVKRPSLHSKGLLRTAAPAT